MDAVTRYHVEERLGVIPFLEELRSSLRDGSLQALPVKQAVTPKKNGKVRYLGIPTLRDRVAQMELKLVLEPIFEADFYPSSYGYRPGRRAQDAIAKINHLTSRPSNYEWVIEGDIKACFDNVDHHVLMDLVGERVKDRKVLRLVSAFLRAGVVELHGGLAETLTGTPQGGVASSLLANIYLSVLDRHFARIWDEEMSRHCVGNTGADGGCRTSGWCDTRMTSSCSCTARGRTRKRSRRRSACCWPVG
ncbi:reverse transcriptase domain-containing protein [Kitasatospora aureofaciens]|uniref:reverse transcriptase domain-containing protein n=1 Tax=Kitasatospora aureofaciens TaxID=1894 RepID=UPI001E2C6226|nr:reverse transcriptase domain-containing protein [Kitasatospora aureofaciens]